MILNRQKPARKIAVPRPQLQRLLGGSSYLAGNRLHRRHATARFPDFQGSGSKKLRKPGTEFLRQIYFYTII